MLVSIVTQSSRGAVTGSEIRLEPVPDPTHIRPTASLAERVLLPGDPGRAMLLAQSLLDEPKMFNHHRGLWGYTGPAKIDGRPLTIQSTGIGGPSAAIVVSELAQLGATSLIRVGTCGALDELIEPGEVVIAIGALCADGTSRAVRGAGNDGGDDGGAPPRIDPAPRLLAALGSAGPGERRALVVSTDLFYDRPPEATQRWLALGAGVVELETATVLALAARRKLEAASVLLVVAGRRRARLTAERLQAGERRIGELAARALSG